MLKNTNYERVTMHRDLAEICRTVNKPIGRDWLSLNSVVQVERIRDTIEGELFQVPDSAKTDSDWILTERWINWDKGGMVMGANRIIASTGFVSHAELHRVMRGWMWSQQYMLDFGPSHCDHASKDSTCTLGKADDEWFRTVMLPEYKRRYLS
jgi:hypothetical protein